MVKRRNIRRKLLGMNLISIGIALVLITVVLLAVEIDNFRRFTLNSLTAQAKIIANNSTAAISFSDNKDAEETLSSLRGVPDIVQAVLYKESGSVFARYLKEGEELDKVKHPGQSGYKFEGRYLSLVQPVSLSGETIGSIYLKYDMKGQYSRFILYGMAFLVMAVIAVVIASKLFSKLQASVTDPILGLAEAMQSVSRSKDYSLRVPIQDVEELHILTKGFNEMLEQIGKWDKELTAHRQNLEELVSVRTAQLQEELAERRKAEEELRKYREELERLVEARTIELTRTNEELQREIREREKMEEELLRAKKIESLGILAGGIAHDFNNLLTGILGNIELAKLDLQPEDKAYDKLKEAAGASLRARDLTLQLLTFSRGGAPIKKVTSVGDMVKESANFVLRGSNVKCRFSIPGDLWAVEVDEGQMSQVVNNLIINASHAMPDGGIIEVDCENVIIGQVNPFLLKNGKYVMISIEDHGIGIAKEHLSKIFDPYFTTKQKGSGLGLATCYSIIRRHSGHVTVDSTLGAGTTFRIFLPASAEEIPPKTQDDQPLPRCEGRVLVMDDEKIVREVAGKMLTLAGYEPEFAEDGLEAIELYEEAMGAKRPFAAVLMDLTIPGGVGGREAVAKLLEIDPGARAIVSSGYSNDPIMADYQAYGFKGVVSKPYKIKDLIETLHKVISGPG